MVFRLGGEPEKPKPCPFCASADVSEERNHTGWPVVQCNDCGAIGPCCDDGRVEANFNWNRRPRLAALEARPDNLTPEEFAAYNLVNGLDK